MQYSKNFIRNHRRLTEETNGIIHVIPNSEKGPTGETIPIRSILDVRFQLSAEERTGLQMLQAWTQAEILMRSGKRMKLSWQLFYDPGQKIYAINIHSVQ